MKLIITKDYEEMSRVTSELISEEIRENPNLVLGLATGGTPMGTYQRLIEFYKDGKLDFKDVKTFNLDEYIGLNINNEKSYHNFMNTNLFNHININKENTFIPNGNAKDIEKEGKEYEGKIEELGGICLQLLGIGSNGHIGFNEPDDKFSRITGPVSLKESTIKANSRYFNSIEEVPTKAISMGIKTIMHAKKIILIANGEKKADAIFKTVMGPITPSVPASVLQLHRDVTIIVDELAASKLEK